MASSLFGWDLLYGSVEKDIKNNNDVLVCLTHLVLVSNGFKCIGLGESKEIDGSETKSESLPKGWNQDYAIRYVYQGRLYNLKATLLDDGVMINLLRVDERNVSLVQLNSRAVAKRSGTLGDMIPDSENMIDLIKKQLIEKVTTSQKSKETYCQTDPTTTKAPENSYRPSNPIRNERLADPMPRFQDSRYGVSDLDPFGGMGPNFSPGVFSPLGRLEDPRSGGGMLYQPPRPSQPISPYPGLAPGSLPPGARFDPFRPPDVDPHLPRRPNRPDNDELPPPGYDDMFM